jgi:DNA-binding MarR family transcriptional regulator
MKARVKPSLAPSGNKDRLRFWLRLLRTTRAVEAELRERLRVEFDTTMPRFDVMAALARKPEGMSMTALSRTLIVSNGNTTGIVDRLVADGLVVRMDHVKDKRATFVRLTREGERRFGAMARVHEGWVEDLLGSIDGQAILEISAHLDRLTPKTRHGETT